MSDKPDRVKRRRHLAVRFEGLDMRSRPARRLKAIFGALVGEFGDANPHSLRELAMHRLALEAAQTAAVIEPSAREDSVRLSNCIARIERELRAGRQKSDTTPSLADYLATKYGEAAA